MTLEEYKPAVRTCQVVVKPGPASDPRDIVEVDWAAYFGTPNQEGHKLLLGYDPVELKWIDEQLQYAPPPLWCQPEPYIQALEAENAALKKAALKK